MLEMFRKNQDPSRSRELGEVGDVMEAELSKGLGDYSRDLTLPFILSFLMGSHWMLSRMVML
jgi:hypothetical protein